MKKIQAPSFQLTARLHNVAQKPTVQIYFAETSECKLFIQSSQTSQVFLVNEMEALMQNDLLVEILRIPIISVYISFEIKQRGHIFLLVLHYLSR